MLDRLTKRLPFHWPHPHFMAMAPLDVWVRLLHLMRWRVGWRYWPRLAAGLFTSFIGTAITLPERLVLAPIMRGAFSKRKHQTDGTGDRSPPIIIILGYYRTGTTHLHYLLSTNPAFITPRWYHTLAPQGFLFSWAFLRLFLLPFLGAKRPQDDVAFGPEWPAEDDFALNNHALCSSLPGRLVAPQMWEKTRRFDHPPSLTESERKRWRFTQWAFVWKLRVLARGRSVLLKTPSHTSRVADLLDLFGRENVRFIHLSRPAPDVVRSNVSMLKRLSVHHLQDGPDDATLRERVVCEYDEMERRYVEARADIPDGHLVEVRFEDLRADPVDTLEHIYKTLGLPLDDTTRTRALTYLNAVSDYRPKANPSKENTNADPRLDWLTSEFGHDQPPAAPVALPPEPPTTASSPTRWHPWVFASATALICTILWLLIANLTHNRYDTFVWPTGIAVGYVVLRSVSAGSVRLGFAAAGLTLLVLLIVAFPNTRTIYYAGQETVSWLDLRQTTWLELTTGPTLFWTFMGMVTAYRFASRSAVRPPGS